MEKPGEEALETTTTDKPAKADKFAHLKRADGTYERKPDEKNEPGPVNFNHTKRKYLEFAEQEVYCGKDFPADTYLLPLKLPVIAHSIKNWSGVRRNGSAAAAYTGFSLNIGKYKKFIHRPGSTAIDVMMLWNTRRIGYLDETDIQVDRDRKIFLLLQVSLRKSL